MKQEQNDEINTHSWPIKFASYLIAIVIALVVGTGISGSFGVIFGIIIFLVMSLSDIRTGLQLMVEEIPQALKSIQNFLSDPSVLPIHEMIDLWHIILFKPLTFKEMKYEAYDLEGIKGLLKIFFRVSVLLLIYFILLALFSKGYPFGFFIFSWITFSLCIVILLVAFRPEVEQQTNFVPVSSLLWFVLISLWVVFVFNWNIVTIGVILQSTSVFGIAIGCAIGVANNIHSPKGFKLSVALAIGVASFYGMFLFSARYPYQYSPDVPPVPLMQVPDDTSSLDALDQIYDYFFDYLNLNEPGFQQPADISSWTFPKLTSSFIWAASTFAFIGALLGIIVGNTGMLLLLFEAPFFYIGAYLLMRGDPQKGLSRLEKVVQFDQWRRLNWWGEDYCYNIVAKKHSDWLGKLLVVQLFGTARHHFVSKKIVDSVFISNTKKSISLLLPFLPFPEFEQLNSLIFPKIESKLLSNYGTVIVWTSSQLAILRKRRLNFFSELIKRAETHPKDNHYSLLQGFHNLTMFLTGNSENILVTSSNVRLEFSKYQDQPHVSSIVSLATAAEKSLSIPDCQGIGRLASVWGVTQEMVGHDRTYSHLKPFVGVLNTLAKAFSTLNASDQKSLGSVSLNNLYLRILLDEQKNQSSSAIPIIRLIANHWDSLLVNHIRAELLDIT